MNFKKIVLVLAGISLFNLGIAQEVLLPLIGNPILQNIEKVKGKIALNKNEGKFPMIDFFGIDGKPNTANWLLNNCRVQSNKVIFNALDSAGNLYPNSGEVDNLISSNFNTVDISQPMFLSFTFSTGETFQGNDSFVVSARNNFGEWEKIWGSPSTATQNREVVIGISKGNFGSNQFALKFTAFTDNLVTSNTSLFTISKLVLSTKWPLGLYEHLRTPRMPDSSANWDYYSSSDVKVLNGLDINYSWGNVAKLDVRKFDGSIHDNASNLYGGADTFYTHPFDVISNDVSDTIVFSFSTKGAGINLLGDSLVVEFKNNFGQWVRAISLGGITPTYFVSHSFNINTGRNRHANFQARFIFKSNYSSTNYAFWMVSGFRMLRKVQLPFFDDFSNSRIVVSNDRWVDKFVYVNNDFPVNQPSLNVATFDGLDANGNAYSKFDTKGICDILTSRSINLKGLTAGDSVILSFYFQYEPQGTTSQVYPDDSLIIEFRNSPMDKDSFALIKMIAAKDTLKSTFTYYQYAITDPKFFHDDFQIRIKNRGSQTGNLSHWHIDYLRFNKGRKLNDAIKDLSLTNTPPIILGQYTSMPWYQYQANKASYSNKSSSLRLVNHDNQPYAVDYFRSVIKPEGDTLDKFNNILPSIKSKSDSTLTIDKPFDFATAASGDSLVFNNRYRIKISGNQNDNVTGNDTFSVPTIFSNYYAYDDGTAEGGYGVKNKINVGACLKYKLEVPDSVVGVYVFFNQSEKDVSTQRFNLKVWKNISPLFEPATSDQVLYSQEIKKPIYTNQINGFTSFRFNSPIAVTDSFYIGWEQTNAYVLNIGLDKNYPFILNPNMAYKMDGRWYPAAIPGALMIRPIMKQFLGIATTINEPLAKIVADFNIYPNPATNHVKVDLKGVDNYQIKLIDLTGKEVANLVSNDGLILLPELSLGVYLILFQDPKSDQKLVRKLLINNK
jgi:hypothetical protein